MNDEEEFGKLTPWEIRAVAVLAVCWGLFLTFALLNSGR